MTDTKFPHCSGCTDPDPLGGTHSFDTIEHGPQPKAKTMKNTIKWRKELYGLLSNKPFSVPQKSMVIQYVDLLLSQARQEGAEEERKRIVKIIKSLYKSGKIHDDAYDEKSNTCWVCNYEWGLDDILTALQKGKKGK